VRRFAVLLVSVVAIVLPLGAASGCGKTTPPPPSPSAESGIRGTAKSGGGPTSDGTTNVWPSSNVTVVAHKGELNGPVVARVVADQDGRFTIDLPPGAYTLVQAEPGGQAKAVTIRAGEFAEVTLWQAVP
jgi:hypothetical protein